ncbi:MAG: hypothetical protein VBE63_17700 [Lamprobacter sp.]|uniref:hypothetical protein n=1 Tax=Lamprobacter sp. TaxID=3100796 RepID=UPI002B2641C7|nr:hypothetical protein [Lamprobacter sp.]MEA3641751.1 hypothetical protein [Lamprobacter sp.]
MQRYTIEKLQLPETYEQDQELATLARRLATQHYEELGRDRVGMGDLKREFLAGQHAGRVAAAVDEIATKADQDAAKANARAKAANALTAPNGYRIEVNPTEILIMGPFDEDLHQRLKRAGGYWDGITQTNRKCWVLPPAKGKSLKRILENWSKSHAETALVQVRAEAERWLGYVEDKAPDYLYQKGVDKLRDLRISRWPELKERLEAAIAACQSEQARRKESARQRAFESNFAEQSRAKGSGASKLRRLYPVSALPPLNVPVELGSSIVVFESTGKVFRISDDAASLHGHQLLGHEGERGCYGYYRPATDAEIAAYREQAQSLQQDRESKAAAQRDLRALIERFTSEGQRPEGSHVLEGVRLLDTQNIYGGGDWWVIEDDHIWYVRNNGADGDDWSRNNIRTGGAGAIGWSLPADAGLIDELRRLANVLG